MSILAVNNAVPADQQMRVQTLPEMVKQFEQRRHQSTKIAIEIFGAIEQAPLTFPQDSDVNYQFYGFESHVNIPAITRCIDVAIDRLHGFSREIESNEPAPTQKEAQRALNTMKTTTNWTNSRQFDRQMPIKLTCEKVFLKYIGKNPETDLAKEASTLLLKDVQSLSHSNVPYFGDLHIAAVKCMHTLLHQLPVAQSAAGGGSAAE